MIIILNEDEIKITLFKSARDAVLERRWALSRYDAPRASFKAANLSGEPNK